MNIVQHSLIIAGTLLSVSCVSVQEPELHPELNPELQVEQQNTQALAALIPQTDACAFPSPGFSPDVQVYAAGSYSGRKSGFQIDQSGHEATRMDIQVNKPGNKVALILGAYEPTIWNIRPTSDTRIVAVLVSGYHRQVIAGLDARTPTLISTYDNRGPCGYFYVNSKDLSPLNPMARRVFSKTVDLVYLVENGAAVLGEPVNSETRFQPPSAITPESFNDNSSPVAGQAGLEDALKKGLLRRATPEDAEAWATTLNEKRPAKDNPPVAGRSIAQLTRPVLLNAFVVLKKFTFPAGLYGGNAATFFIPEGVQVPDGNPGHSALYNFNTLSCQGALCNIQ